MLILGIESSCDETAAAVVRDGDEILSSIISSQIDIHRPYGGVVPEVASREHLAQIEPVVTEALKKAGVSLADIDAVAVTQGPGLVGSLLVGVCFAKALAYAAGLPIIGVNHIEGHVFSVVFENGPIEYPALALIVSGGHTNIFHVRAPGQYEIASRTRDDAAGEAFDKVSKMLGLGYPGGPVIEKTAAGGDPRAVKFARAKISDGKPDLSFSGLKTAVSRYIRETGLQPVTEGSAPSAAVCDLAASFQFAVVDALTSTLLKLAREYLPKTIIVAGGVASNQALRQAADKIGGELGIPVYFPSRHLSTDNAAMIAAAGYFHLERGESDGFDMTADVTMRLQNAGLRETAADRRKIRYRT